MSESVQNHPSVGGCPVSYSLKSKRPRQRYRNPLAEKAYRFYADNKGMVDYDSVLESHDCSYQKSRLQSLEGSLPGKKAVFRSIFVKSFAHGYHQAKPGEVLPCSKEVKRKMENVRNQSANHKEAGLISHNLGLLVREAIREGGLHRQQAKKKAGWELKK